MGAGTYVARAAELFDVTPLDIVGPRRFQNMTVARFAVCYALRHKTRLSSTQIGQLLGGRDHSTVLSAIRSAEVRIERWPWFAEKIEQLLSPEYVPPAPVVELRHPAVLTKRIKPKNETAAGDTDARMRMHGTNALLQAIQAARAA